MGRLIRCATALLFLCAVSPLPVHAADAPPPQTMSPDEARRALDVLQDDKKRAATIAVLKTLASQDPAAASSAAQAPAIAAPGPASSTAAPAPAPAAATAPAPAPASSTATAAASPVPLEADGLIARMLRSVGEWEDGLREQTAQLRRVAQSLPLLANHAVRNIERGPYRAQLWQLLLNLAAVAAAAVLLEWLLRRLLTRPREALVAHADMIDRRAKRDDAWRETLRQREAATAAEAAAEQSAAVAASGAPTTPGAADAPPEAVALVRTQKDGVERVEAVPVDAGDAAAPAAPGMSAASPAAATAAESLADADMAAQRSDHWRTLRHLPFALASLVLELIPPLLIFIVAGVILRLLPGDARLDSIATGFVEAYIFVRVAMTFLRLLVSPTGHGLRLVCVAESTARTLLSWSRRILVIATVGFAIANALHTLGASNEQRLALVKLISLVVHICLTILVFRVRRPVAAGIEAPPGSEGPLVAMRHWLAQAWAPAAAVLIMGLWVVWALGVEDGFSRLMHFAGNTLAVLVVARVIAVLVLGGVGHVFHPASTTEGNGDEHPGWARRVHAERYYPLVRGVVTGVLVVASAIALLQVWGVDALGWFERGTIGRSLASAAVTILVAATIAVLVWEFANAGVDRRLSRWTKSGDVVRAARLRTLLPMLRTCLLVIIVLIVGLTALSQIGVNTAPLLAGASIIGVALGFGSQKLVQDFITGIFLLMENAMQVGDWITVGGVSGSVEYLSIRTVRLRGGDGSLYIVPFSSVTTVNNTNRGIGNAAMRISVVFDTDVSRAIDELKGIGAGLRADDRLGPMILGDIEIWGVDDVDGGMYTLAGQIRCSDKGRWGVQRELNRRILERFREIGIAISNPRTTLVQAAALPPASPP